MNTGRDDMDCGRKRAGRSQSGLTLVELLVGVSLISVALLPILQALVSAQVTQAESHRTSEALFHATERIEEIMAQSLSSFDVSFSCTSQTLSGGFLCTVSTSTVSSLIREISVRVGYDDDGDGSLDSAEIDANLSTLVSRRY